MSEKINISKQLEQSATAGSIIVTDGSNNPKYLPPGAEGTVLGVSSGVPAYITASNGSSFPIATGGGTANAITATYSPALTLTDKTICAVVALYANTTTTPTFAPNGLTARTIVKHGGQPLAIGDIPNPLYICLLEYNLANTRWELLNPANALSSVLTLNNKTGNNDIVLSNNGGVLTKKITEDTGNSYINFNGNTGTSKDMNIIVPTGKIVTISDGTYIFGLNISGQPFYFSSYTWFNSGVKIAGGGLDLTGNLVLQTGGVLQSLAVDNQLRGKLILGASGATQGEIEMYNNTDGSFVLLKSSSKKLKINNTANDVAVGLNMDPVAGVDLSIAGIVNLAANDKFKINNTQVFEEVAETLYTGTITWDGTAPTSKIDANCTYRWSRVGKVVTLRIHLRYTGAGSLNSNVTMTLPSGCPTPQDPAGFSAANDIAYMGAGSLGTGPGNATGGNTKAYLGPNATATGYLVTINTASTLSAKVARFEVDYFIA